MNHTIIKEITVTQDDIEFIMQEGLKSIGYWADDVYCPKQRREVAPNLTFDQALADGYYLNVHDREKDKWHKLTRTKFLKGLKLMDNHNFEQYDMLSGDQVIQYALFGKQVYA